MLLGLFAGKMADNVEWANSARRVRGACVIDSYVNSFKLSIEIDFLLKMRRLFMTKTKRPGSFKTFLEKVQKSIHCRQDVHTKHILYKL